MEFILHITNPCVGSWSLYSTLLTPVRGRVVSSLVNRKTLLGSEANWGRTPFLPPPWTFLEIEPKTWFVRIVYSNHLAMVSNRLKECNLGIDNQMTLTSLLSLGNVLHHSLYSFPPSGTLTSVTLFAQSVSRNMDRLSLDADHTLRQETSRRQKPQALSQGLKQGLNGLALSFLGKMIALRLFLIRIFDWQRVFRIRMTCAVWSFVSSIQGTSKLPGKFLKS